MKMAVTRHVKWGLRQSRLLVNWINIERLSGGVRGT